MIMLADRGAKLQWTSRDDTKMAEILGLGGEEWETYGEESRRPMEAERLTTLNDSVLLAAHLAGVQLSQAARARLVAAVRLRRELRTRRHAKDDDRFSLIPKAWPHQRVAMSYIAAARLHAQNFLLADDPGVGKTLVAIWLARYLHATDVLVLCRNSAKWQWHDEIRRYDQRTRLDAPRLHGDKLPVSVLDGTIPEQAATLAKRGWVVAHHEAMVHCQLPMIERDWQLVIFDEAHHLRSRDTERYRTAMRLSGVRFAMTAHPFAKAPDELFSILHWLDDETYPSYWRWFRQHVEATKRFFGGFKIHGVRDAKLLRWEIEPFSLRREFSQVFPKAPPPTLSILTLDLPLKYRRDYERLKRELFVELESAPDDAPALLIPNVLARVTRLRQFAVDPGLLGSKLRPMKYDLVLEMLEDRGKPTIFFTSFEKVAASFAAKLPKRYTRAVYSGKTKKTREQAKLNFQRGKIDALFVVTQAGGESLNLGGFGGCGFIDLPWTRMAVDQAIGRVHRPVEGSGELIPAVASAFITRDTYEWRIYERVKERGRMFGEVFTVHQLKGLFA